ncbi:uncharacterized protein LOC110859015 [Folsomia candida]|uniref:uncharacterized protein LOC110858994 n=1 Tax=Folsomia candida TaxID=158441 RepID=UPI000B905B7C|nr:uncharacterized protein LOC110858994 [Folsomia candida]XP_021963581.1 uncharacterized protein LOC110859015 [Folsomia candida]
MVDETEFLEGSVLIPKTFPDLDWAWFNSVPRWYWTYWSKVDLIRSAAFMKQKSVGEVTSEDIANPNNCMDMESNLLHGFGLKDVPFKLVFDEEKTMVFGEDKHHVVFSDNATFAVGVTTWKDGETSWVCWNTKQNIDDDLKEKVLEVVTGLGFKAEMAVETVFKE